MLTSFNDDIEYFKDTGIKSYNLARAINMGFNVPRYICLTTEDFYNGKITEKSMNDLLNIIGKNFDSNTHFAVRNSLNINDSFLSELFDNFITVPINRLEEIINKSLEPLNTKRVQSYIKRHEILESIKLNIIIQEMISQEDCGVMFTSNPMGIISERMIVSGSGFCNDILEDKHIFNTYYYNIYDKQSYSIQNDNVAPLSTNNLNDLYNILNTFEKTFGKPFKIDFSIQNDDIYILQVEELQNFSIDKIITLQRANMMMSYDKKILPLTVSFIKDCYSKVFSNLILHLTNSEHLIKTHQEIFDNIISTYNGKPYFNINNLYEIFSMIPFSKRILGNGTILNTVTSSFNTIKAIFKSSKQIEDISNSFPQVKKLFNDCYSEELSDIQLKTLYRVILSRTIEKWDINIINSIYCHFNDFMQKKFLNKENHSIGKENPLPNMAIENGVAGVIQEHILLELSGNDTINQTGLELYKYIKRIFMQMGNNLVNLGYLENIEDVYYLTVSELFNEGIHSYKDIVSQRKITYSFYDKLPQYEHITFNGKITNKSIIKQGIIYDS